MIIIFLVSNSNFQKIKGVIWKPLVTRISRFPGGDGRSTCALSTWGGERLRAFSTFHNIFFVLNSL